ncbi:MAG: hypothetical protein AAF629_12230 [Chloroflexota bacterium]
MDKRDKGLSMKKYGIIFGLVIVLTMLAIIGFKLSNDALAVMLGVGLGILASVPTTILLYYLLTKQNDPQSNLHPHPSRPGLHQQHPPVVIVNGGNQPGLQTGTPPAQYQMEVPNARQFTIVGEESTDV